MGTERLWCAAGDDSDNVENSGSYRRWQSVTWWCEGAVAGCARANTAIDVDHVVGAQVAAKALSETTIKQSV